MINEDEQLKWPFRKIPCTIGRACKQEVLCLLHQNLRCCACVLGCELSVRTSNIRLAGFNSPLSCFQHAAAENAHKNLRAHELFK